MSERQVYEDRTRSTLLGDAERLPEGPDELARLFYLTAWNASLCKTVVGAWPVMQIWGIESAMQV